MALASRERGLATAKRVSKKRNSYFSFASERREETLASGFTLIELLVVIAIITIISGIIFTSQSSFNKTLILANTAYDVALSLRGAETYGLGGHALSAVPTGYGLHFDRATPGSFLLFADSYPAASSGSACHAPTNTGGGLDAQPGDCSYESGTGKDTTVSNYTLGNNITVSDFCAFAAGAWTEWSVPFFPNGEPRFPEEAQRGQSGPSLFFTGPRPKFSALPVCPQSTVY